MGVEQAAAGRPRYDEPVVLVGLDTIQGLQAARIFARRGVRVIGIVSDPAYYASRTGVCERVVPIGDRTLGAVLDGVADDLDRRAFLLPCHDSHVAEIARDQDRLRQRFDLAMPPVEVVMMLQDKTAFSAAGVDFGLAMPATWILPVGEDTADLASEVTYPVAAKPSYRTGAWMDAIGEKALRIEDPESLADLARRAVGLTDALVLQSWIHGTDEDLYSCNGYFRDGEPLATFTARKIRQWPPRAGQSCLGEEVECEEVLHETLLLAKATAYTGLLYLETKRDRITGVHHVVEPNVARPTGRSAIAEAGGVELLMTAYCDATGAPLPAERTQTFRGVKWIHLLRDLRSAWFYMRHGELGVGDWLRSLRGRKAFAVWSVRDPMPFVWALASMVSIRRSEQA